MLEQILFFIEHNSMLQLYTFSTLTRKRARVYVSFRFQMKFFGDNIELQDCWRSITIKLTNKSETHTFSEQFIEMRLISDQIQFMEMEYHHHQNQEVAIIVVTNDYSKAQKVTC